MTSRKLSRAIAVAAIGAAALIAFPAPAATAQPVEDVGYLADLCSGEGDGYTATVNLRQSSAFGVAAEGFIETSDGTLQGTPDDDVVFANDGTIDVVYTLVNEETGESAGTATVTGTYSVSGETTRFHQVIREAPIILVSVGTHTPLTVDLTLEYAGTTIDLDCTDAFAFDLLVVEQVIGNIDDR